jgi:hypothetical protein
LTGRIEGGARRFHPPPRSSHDSSGRQARDRALVIRYSRF